MGDITTSQNKCAKSAQLADSTSKIVSDTSLSTGITISTTFGSKYFKEIMETLEDFQTQRKIHQKYRF